MQPGRHNLKPMESGMRVSFLISLLLLAAPSHAVWHWMRGSALSDFSESDWEILKDTARVVLNEKPDREQVNWTNPDTGNKGSIMALATFQHEGRTCRRAAMRNITHRGREDRAAYSLCQQADGDWIFVAESALLDASSEASTDNSGSDPSSTNP